MYDSEKKPNDPKVSTTRETFFVNGAEVIKGQRVHYHGLPACEDRFADAKGNIVTPDASINAPQAGN